ncbi:hypothetical protein ACFLU8_00510 [Chloroflexota bacterium]
MTTYLDHRDWVAEEIQKEVNDILRKRNPLVKLNWPGLSAVQKILTNIRSRAKDIESEPEDRLWSVPSLAEHEIPPQALPAVLNVWALTLEQNFPPFTIREAKWVARLSCVIETPFSLWWWANAVAHKERVMKVTGSYHTDRELDSVLYTHNTGKDIKVDKETLRAIKSRENEEWRKIKEVYDERTRSKKIQE